jgi:DNA-binding LytR/AlgR family response regulator
MSHDPIRSESAAASPCMQAPLTQRQMYKITADEANYYKFLEATSPPDQVVMLEALDNDVKIHRPLGNFETVTYTFVKACEHLTGKLFYQPFRGKLVNLAYFVEFKKCGRCVSIILINDIEIKLCRKALKGLKTLREYLKSDEYFKEKFVHFVM